MEQTVLLFGEPVTQLPQDLYIPPDALRVLLDTFSGPLDLLIYLIRKQNIDILDIPVTLITEQYLAYLDLMEEMDMVLAAEYLLMAATLAEIKARMMLPRPPQSDDDEPETDPPNKYWPTSRPGKRRKTSLPCPALVPARLYPHTYRRRVRSPSSNHRRMRTNWPTCCANFGCATTCAAHTKSKTKATRSPSAWTACRRASGITPTGSYSPLSTVRAKDAKALWSA